MGSQNSYPILKNTQVVKNKTYGSSHKLVITKDMNNQIIIQSTGDSYYKSCYISKLFLKKKKYRIILKYSQPSLEYPYFVFGLVKPENKDFEDFYWRSDCNPNRVYLDMCTNWDVGYCDTSNKVIKGTNMCISEKSQGEQRIEIRFDIKSRFWRVASFPGYENVQELDDPERMEDCDYLFGIYLYHLDESVTIEDIIEVQSFDSKM